MHSKLGSRAVVVEKEPGFEHETNDCFVRAMKAVTGVPYRDAHAFVKARFNREDAHGTGFIDSRLCDIQLKRETIYGYRVFRIAIHSVGRSVKVVTDSYGHRMRYNRARYGTLNQFVATHRTGRFLVWSNNHAFAVIDGIVYDNGAAGPRTQVTGGYEFKASSSLEAL